MKKLIPILILFVTTISSSAHYGCCNPRKYNIEFDNNFDSNDWQKGVLRKFPVLTFYEKKDLTGQAYAKLDKKGLFINKTKMCSLVKVKKKDKSTEFLLDRDYVKSNEKYNFDYDVYRSNLIDKTCRIYPFILNVGVSGKFAFRIEATEKVSEDVYTIRLDGKNLYFKVFKSKSIKITPPTKVTLDSLKSSHKGALKILNQFRECVNKDDFKCPKLNYKFLEEKFKEAKEMSSLEDYEVSVAASFCLEVKNMTLEKEKSSLTFKAEVLNGKDRFTCMIEIVKNKGKWSFSDFDIYKEGIFYPSEENYLLSNHLVEEYLKYFRSWKPSLVNEKRPKWYLDMKRDVLKD